MRFVGVVSALVGLHPKIEYCLNIKTRRLYKVYEILLGCLKTTSEFSYVEFCRHYSWFMDKDVRIFYSSFMIRVNCSPAYKEEIFLSLIIPLQEPHWDTSDLLTFIRYIFVFDLRIECATRKFMMLTNG